MGESDIPNSVQTSSSPSPNDAATLVPRKSIVKKAIAAALLFLALAGTAGAYWWLRLGASDSSPIQLSDDEIRALALLQYLPRTPVDANSFTSEHQELLDQLEPRLTNVDKEVNDAVEQLCNRDSHLAVALKDTASASLVGDEPPRTKQQRLAGNSRIVDILIDDLRQRSVPSDGRTSKIDGNLIAATKSALTERLCRGRIEARTIEPLQNAYQSGLRDPLVLGLLISQISEDDPTQKARWNELFQSLSTNPCGPVLRASILSDWDRNRDAMEKQEFASMQVEGREVLINAFAEYSSDPVVVDYLFQNVKRHFRSSNYYGKQQWILRSLELSGESYPEWIVHYLAYDWTNEIAMKHRGIHFISKTDPTGLEHFDQFGHIAARHLCKAWSLRPESPEFSARLLECAYWMGETPLSSHSWFRIAISNEIDDEDLYREYSNSLMPKWGGSDRQLYRLAHQIGASAESLKRFNVGEYPSQLPLLAPIVLGHVTHDIGYDRDTLSLSALVPVLQAVNYLKNFPAIGDQHLYGRKAIMMARTLWDWGRLEELGFLFDRFPRAFDQESSFTQYYTSIALYREISQSAKQGNPFLWQFLHRDLLGDNRNLNSEKLDEIESAILELSETCDDLSEPGLDVCRTLCKWRRDFDSGKPVAIDLQSNPSCWAFNLMPTKSIEGGFSTTIYDDNNFAAAAIWLRFPTPFRFEADIERIDAEKLPDFYGIALFAGSPTYTDDGDATVRGAVIRYSPSQPGVVADQLPGNAFNMDPKLGQTATFYELERAGKRRIGMEVRDSGVVFFLDGEQLERSINQPVINSGLLQVGRFCPIHDEIAKHEEVTYEVTNIQVTKLSHP